MRTPLFAIPMQLTIISLFISLFTSLFISLFISLFLSIFLSLYMYICNIYIHIHTHIIDIMQRRRSCARPRRYCRRFADRPALRAGRYHSRKRGRFVCVCVCVCVCVWAGLRACGCPRMQVRRRHAGTFEPIQVCTFTAARAARLCADRAARCGFGLQHLVRFTLSKPSRVVPYCLFLLLYCSTCRINAPLVPIPPRPEASRRRAAGLPGHRAVVPLVQDSGGASCPALLV